MPAYFNIDFTYDPQPIVDLYNSTNTNFKAVLPTGISTSTVFDSYFDLVTTAIVPRDDRSIEIRKIARDDGIPRVNLNNDGFIVFPTKEIGKAFLNTYSYTLPVDSSGRPTLDGVNTATVVATLTTSTPIVSPMVIDGLTPYSFSYTIGHPLPMLLILKISKTVSWKTVCNTLLKS
jgi:hypothetical protein